MTTDDVQDWLDRYVRAWQTYDPDAIGELFADDARYRYAPWGEPVRGRDAIVASWLAPDGDASERDEGEAEPVEETDFRVVAEHTFPGNEGSRL